MRAVLRTLDHEGGRCSIGRERARIAQGFDALVDQGAEGGFHDGCRGGTTAA
jgi:hypothetical protein